MCGIAGLVSTGRLPARWRHDLVAMTDALTHRGPDDFGYFWGQAGEAPVQDVHQAGDGNGDARVAFGHRRLSILDLSINGRQPMVRDGGRLFITYNGELYNYRALRDELV